MILFGDIFEVTAPTIFHLIFPLSSYMPTAYPRLPSRRIFSETTSIASLILVIN